MIEDVHFTRAQSAASIGERALARSLSDIAAMGGEPRFCLVALAASQTRSGSRISIAGCCGLAKRTGVALAGGDLARDEKIHCDVMVCGSVAAWKSAAARWRARGRFAFCFGAAGKAVGPADSAAARAGPELARAGDVVHRFERRAFARFASAVRRIETSRRRSIACRCCEDRR